jgi:Histidine kinase/Histidine kinase-, DNA gyrase B-, and HSP90-like ATPase
MSSRSGPRPAAPSRPWLWYAGAMAAVGLLLGTAELQHYLESGGQHPWEPYLWETSSAVMTAVLAPLVYRWHVAGLERGGLAWRHAVGAISYILAHVGGMFAIRFVAYGLSGVGYHPGSPVQVLAYEAGKDVVSYALIAAVCHGLHLFVDSQRLRSELAEARLARLGEQLQPHFLFNSLNLISSVMYEDVPRADRLLCELSALLRQTLAAQQSPEHTLGEELALIEPYLSLMRARFGPRLAVSIEADDAARRCPVPTLMLISPVENAIKHGVAQAEGEVQVSIRAWLDGNNLQLAVDNSGPPPERTEREGAIGMENLRQRLQALHHQRSKLALRPREHGGTTLRITLPARAGTAP